MKDTLINRLSTARSDASVLLEDYECCIKAMKPSSLRTRQIRRRDTIRGLLRLSEDMRREIERLEAKLEAPQ